MKNNTLHMKWLPVHFFLAWFMMEMIQTQPCIHAWDKAWEVWYGARLSAAKSNSVNLILRLFLYHFLHTMSSWHHESIHNNTNNQQTPPPWWWSRSLLQRHEFVESTPSKWWGALRMFVPRLLLKGFGTINKLMQKSIYVHWPYG